MSYWTTPSNATSVKLDAAGSSLTASLDNLPQHETPDRIDKFLKQMGWNHATTDPNTSEQLYSKDDQIHNENGLFENGTSGFYYRWYEAVAYEFYKMMTIGGMVGEQEEQKDA